MRLLFANAILAGILWWAGGSLQYWFNLDWEMRFVHLFLWLGVAGIAYLACLWISGMRLRHFTSPGLAD